ncbi:MAG: PHP domain-containing protein [Candidatus Ornithomonoglobus sp.]
MTNRVDLHTHSTASDGTYSPSELARLAKEIGLSAIALTDHDSNDGISEFMEECGRLGIEGIPGIEISTDYEKQLHIVGLYNSGDEFDKTVKRLKNARAERNIKMFEKIRDYGFDITAEDILENGKVTIEHAGRLHMANALVRKGYAADKNDAFDRFLMRGRPCYVEKFSLSPEESVKLIKRCGGIAIWAHPALAMDNEGDMLEMAEKLKAAGLDAMECCYSTYTEEMSRMCKAVAQKAELLMSGGSDFHGANKPDVKLGVVSEGFVPYEVLEQLKQRIGI